MGIKTIKVLRTISKIALLAVVLGLLGWGGYYVYRSIAFKPQNIVVTNVTDSSATITWTTSSQMNGVVYYKKDSSVLPGPLGIIGSRIGYDDRDVSDAQTACVNEFNKNASETKDENFSVSGEDFDCDNARVTGMGKYYTHSVTIKDLDPESTYYFSMGDGIWSFKSDVSSLKTFALLEEVKEPSPVFGKVVGDDGTYSRDGLIYITFSDGSEGKNSILYSSTSNDEGGWYLDASGVRYEDGEVLPLELTNDSFDMYGVYSNYGKSDVVTYILGYFNGAYPDIVVEKNAKPISSFLQKFILGVYADCTSDPDGANCPATSCNYCPSYITNAQYEAITKGTDTTGEIAKAIGYGNAAKIVANNNGGQFTQSDLTKIGLSTDVGNMNALVSTGVQTFRDTGEESEITINYNGGSVAGTSYCSGKKYCKSANNCVETDGKCGYSAPKSPVVKTGAEVAKTEGDECDPANGTSCKAVGNDSQKCTYTGKDPVDNAKIYKLITWKGSTDCGKTSVVDTNACKDKEENDSCTNGGKGRCLPNGGVLKCDLWAGDPCTGGTYNAEGECISEAGTCAEKKEDDPCANNGEKGRCLPNGNVLKCDLWAGDPCPGGKFNAEGKCIVPDAKCTIVKNAKGCSIKCEGQAPIDLESSGKCQKVYGGYDEMDTLTPVTVLASQINPWRLSQDRIEILIGESPVVEAAAIEEMKTCAAEKPVDTSVQGDGCVKICQAMGGKAKYELWDGSTKVANSAGVAWGKFVDCVVDGKSNLSFKIIKKIFASETSTNDVYSFYLPESGLYSFEIDGGQVTTANTNGSNVQMFYIEANGVKGFQPPADFDNPTADEDIVLSENAYEISYEQKSTAQEYNIEEGINIISFNFVPTSTDSGAYMASDVISQAKTNDVDIEYISTFEGGRWYEAYSCSSDACTGTNFSIVPGRGYLVKATNAGTITIPGYNLKSSIPVAFSSGWNLVGIHGYTTAYTARTLIDSINKIEGLTSNNVSWWPISKGKYEGLQVENNTEYGLDFAISPTNGYFVRISEYAPSDTTCKSILWNEGGTLNGTCGNTK